MTESPDPMAEAGRDHIRASHADREHAIDTLKAAFVQGRLTKDEFDQRVGQAFDSKTYAELAALSADLPAGPTRPLSQPGRAQGWSLGDEKVLAWAIASALSPLARWRPPFSPEARSLRRCRSSCSYSISSSGFPS